MPITGPYLSAKLAVIKLVHLNIPATINVIDRMNSLGLTGVSAIYKANVKNYVKNEVEIYAKEAIAHALSGAVESGTKNQLLATVIAGVLVNPGQFANTIEQTALLIDAAKTAIEVKDIILSVNNL